MCFAEQPGGCLVGANVPGRCQEAFSPLVQKGHLHSLVLCISNCVCFPRNNVRVSLHHKMDNRLPAVSSLRQGLSVGFGVSPPQGSCWGGRDLVQLPLPQ